MKRQKKVLSKRWFALVIVGLLIAACVITMLPWRIIAENIETDGEGSVVFDPQPTCLEDVQAAIDEYEAALENESAESGNIVQKPHWQDDVDASFIPEGYSCKIVENDDSFAAKYYTFFIDEPKPAPEETEAAEAVDFEFDPQPTTKEEVKAAIDAYKAEYQAVLKTDGFMAALAVQKPHWQNPVDASLLPKGYSCQLVNWDVVFTAEYYTFFPGITPAADEVTATKSAKVLPSGAKNNGTAASPVPVKYGDRIEYSIGVDIPAVLDTAAKYDIVFALDWSGSMDALYGTSGDSARIRAKNTILEMSKRVFANYPDSRIAVMGMNSSSNNVHIPNYTYLQIDSNFAGASEYAAVIENAFSNEPQYKHDDVPMFLQAASDKLSGNARLYGGNITNVAHRKNVNVRTDKSRIPVIVLISDFQPDTTATISTYFNTLKSVATNFKNLYADGILITIRTDHANNGPCSTATFNTNMDSVINVGAGRWGWTKFTSAQSVAQQDDALWALLGDYVPAVIYPPGTITDVLPDGLEYISSTGGGVLGADGKTITWNLSELPKDASTITVTARVKGHGTFVNKATVHADGYDAVQTNATYHHADPPEPPTATKSAKVLPDGSTDTGTSASPVPVKVGDEIEYTIAVDNLPATIDTAAKYDIVFALDWSHSMDNPYGTSGTYARVLAKDTILEMSKRLFANYPGSRIAVMGMNCDRNNLNTPNYLYLQIDSDFADASQYASVIEHAFDIGPTFYEDDVPMFIRAAKEKLAGISTTVYGSSIPGSYQRQVNARTDMSRIPVIVLISDFQHLSGTPVSTYWNNINSQVDDLKTKLPDGILLNVRTDHRNNTAYSNADHNNRMDALIAKGGGKWAWTKFTASQTPAQQNDALWALLGDYVPAVVYPPGIITDVLPDGLEYVSSTGGGVLGADGKTVTWDLDELPKDASTITVTVRVTKPGTYVNKATIDIEGYGIVETNETYHRAEPPTGTKSAKVLPNGAIDNGTDASPVPVEIGDEIEYTIAINSDIVTTGSAAKYDIVFALDWSGSMDSPYGTGGTFARVLAKDTILEMSKRLFANYPGSRIAVMGMNCDKNNANTPNYLYLQIDSDFADATQYASVIEHAFDIGPKFIQDDVPMFIKAATEKLAGISTTVYGSGITGSFQKQVNARTDKSRIPVVVLISDFEHLSTPINTYWNSINDEVDDFKAKLPDGILLNVRTDHNNNGSYSNADHNNRMDTLIAKGGGKWAWTKFTESQTPAQQNDALWKLLGDYVPAKTYPPATITDVLPDGLEYVSSTGGGVLGADGKTVTWDIDELPTGTTSVKVIVRVKENGKFVNKATIKVDGLDPFDTNETYHRAEYSAINLRVSKTIGNINDFGASGSPAYNDLANRKFAISLSGAVKGSVKLKHGETSGNMAFEITTASATINVSEIIPMEFKDFSVVAQISHKDGTNSTLTSKSFTVLPGDDVLITVTNTYERKPFFKASNWIDNLFEPAP